MVWDGLVNLLVKSWRGGDWRLGMGVDMGGRIAFGCVWAVLALWKLYEDIPDSGKHIKAKYVG